MKILAINGSPRKTHNTAELLRHALEGAAAQGAHQGETVHLYDLNFKGCVSCFACKLKDGKSYGKCGYRDELSPVLDKAFEADALVLGSPIYFEAVTGEMRSFMERLMFSVLVYNESYGSLLEKKIHTGFIYTMNVPEKLMHELQYPQALKFGENDMARLLGSCESLFVNDTLQFDDYSKYVVTVFDENAKKKVREEQFPRDCESAFQLGARLIQKASHK
ncbi:MAG: flavodoxin family protein [Defluviitaleaceae bacterium]|nr:flavodoxin family protein [Defluviitaleaceae bacterium]